MTRTIFCPDDSYRALVPAATSAVPNAELAHAKAARIGFWRKTRWFVSGLAVAGGIAVFAYRTGNDTMELLGNARDALLWAISGAEAARKREEHLLAALNSYRMQLLSQQIILERLDKLPMCRSVIEVSPKTVPSRRGVRSDKRLPTEDEAKKRPRGFSIDELSRIFGSRP